MTGFRIGTIRVDRQYRPGQKELYSNKWMHWTYHLAACWGPSSLGNKLFIGAFNCATCNYHRHKNNKLLFIKRDIPPPHKTKVCCQAYILYVMPISKIKFNSWCTVCVCLIVFCLFVCLFICLFFVVFF